MPRGNVDEPPRPRMMVLSRTQRCPPPIMPQPGAGERAAPPSPAPHQHVQALAASPFSVCTQASPKTE